MKLDWSIDRSIDWLINWLIEGLTYWLRYTSKQLFHLSDLQTVYCSFSMDDSFNATFSVPSESRYIVTRLRVSGFVCYKQTHDKYYICWLCPQGTYADGIHPRCIDCPLGKYNKKEKKSQNQTNQCDSFPCRINLYENFMALLID